MAEAEAESEPQSPGPSGSGQRKKVSFRRNVTTNYLIAVVLVAVGFVTTPILTHQLGILRYGVWALIGSLIPFLEILELGFASATIAFVSRHLELEDDEQVARTLNTSFLVLSVLGLVAFAGVVVFAIFLPDIITSIPKSLVGQAQFLLLLLAFDMALSIPLDTFGGVLSALQRFDLLNYSLIGVTVSQAIGWVIVLVAARRAHRPRRRDRRDEHGGPGVETDHGPPTACHGSVSRSGDSTAASSNDSRRHRAGTPSVRSPTRS